MKLLSKHTLAAALMLPVLVVAVVLALSVTPVAALPTIGTFAAANCQDKNLTGGVAMQCLENTYLNPFITFLSVLVGVVVVISVIVGAIQFSSSSGDPQKAAAAKKRITNALIGLLAYLLLYAFLQFIIPGGKLNG